MLVTELACFVLANGRIIPESAHSAYDKAAQYFKIAVCRAPVNKEFKADVKAVRRLINKNTILVCISYVVSSCNIIIVVSVRWYG